MGGAHMRPALTSSKIKYAWQFYSIICTSEPAHVCFYISLTGFPLRYILVGERECLSSFLPKHSHQKFARGQVVWCCHFRTGVSTDIFGSIGSGAVLK